MAKTGKTSSRPSRTVAERGAGKAAAASAAPGQVAALSADVASCIAEGARRYRKGQFREAMEIVVQGLAIDPDQADLLNHRGVIAARLGDAPTAEASYRRALGVRPGSAETCYNLGNLLKAQQRPDEAEAAYRRALALKPDYVEACSNLGNLLLAQNRPAEAEAAYRAAIAMRPDHADSWSNLGNLLQAQTRWQEAEAAYCRAVELKPDYAEALSNLGVLLKKQRRWEEAEAAYRRAVAAQPAYAEVYSNLGVLLMEQKRLDEAEEACRRAIALRPDHADACSNLGNLFQAQKRPREAELAYRRAIAARPDCADAHWNLSLLLLRRGRLAEGWREHEARYAPARRDRKALPPPVVAGGAPLPRQWQGEALAGRRLLIWPEQGLGDEIQFVRYLPMLKARGLKHLTLACKPPLLALFSAQGFADRVISTADWHPEMATEFDYWCYSLSLPLHFGTTLDNLPARIPYLRTTPDKMAFWKTRLPHTAPRIALVWKGSPTHKNDANRSLPSLAALAPLWSVPGLSFVSLQKGAGEEDVLALAAGQPLTHLGDQMADFADSAAILSQMDLLICVDTAIAHLAGALGVPCWVLLPDYGTDWRWLEDRSDSPWYPGCMRLFRQTADGDWNGVVAQVLEALGRWRAGMGQPGIAAPGIAGVGSRAPSLSSGWTCFGRNADLQTTFDAAVVMPTIGRDCVLDAVRSVYAQQDVGRIQLLIGVDVPRGDFARLEELLAAAPDHVTPCLFYPGYSTSQRHGGLHPAGDGGVLRTILSYLANARHLAYLDDDNWWAPQHLSALLKAIEGRPWAFAQRCFVHPESRQPVCVDDWESVGPGRGIFLARFGGWVDPNCLMIDKLACEPVLRWWGIPLPGDKGRMAADRHVYAWLQKHGVPGETGQASVFYTMQPNDGLHAMRLERMGSRYAAAGSAVG